MLRSSQKKSWKERFEYLPMLMQCNFILCKAEEQLTHCLLLKKAREIWRKRESAWQILRRYLIRVSQKVIRVRNEKKSPRKICIVRAVMNFYQMSKMKIRVESEFSDDLGKQVSVQQNFVLCPRFRQRLLTKQQCAKRLDLHQSTAASTWWCSPRPRLG